MIRFFREFKKQVIILFVLWLAIHLYLYFTSGIHTNLEATKYVNAANYFLEHGSFPEKKYLFYALTPLLIALNIKLGLGFTGAVIMQSILSLISMFIFFRLCYSLSANKTGSFIATAILILFIPYQSWNLYLYTESIFLSSVIFFIHAAYKLAVSKGKRTTEIIYFLITLLLTVTARPFGMLFLPAVIVFVLALMPKRFAVFGMFITAGILGLMYYFLNRAFSGSVDWDAMVSNVNGNIICDLRNENFVQPLDLAASGDPVYQLFYYVFHNPAHFLRLSVYRLRSFFIITRDYYSGAHNAVLIAYMVVIYGLVIAGFRNFFKKVPRPFFLFIISAIVFYSFAITLQCDDYHSRFIMALIPMFLIVAGFATGVFTRITKKKI